MKRRQLKKYNLHEIEQLEKINTQEISDDDTLMRLCVHRITLEALTAKAVAWRSPTPGKESLSFDITRHDVAVKAWNRAGRHVESLYTIPEMALCQESRNFLEVFLGKEIEQMDEVKSDIPFGLSEDDEARLQSYRIALMILTSEPKAWVTWNDRIPLPAITQSPDIAQSWKCNGFQVMPLYSVPDFS
ncbi:TPA: hypothetical protein PPI74_004955 [Escherichia coli]|uniref:hypothetical protein n=1 Tax=Escherichia coli TaxID=562 RepID=UPI0018E89CA2|nr:hypothetical protein [Escherichia coli]MBJ2084661.1 hypothetical protein [Escherichia coli]HDJ0741763.1 hypothetical protein [Escherichia coli]